MIIAVGTSRFDINWQNKDITWEDLLKKLQTTTHTPETQKEYFSIKDSKKQANIKDVGGFVGGELTLDGHRRKSEVVNRTMITFDLDDCTTETIANIEQIKDFNWCYYSTHKHTPDKPRLRVLIPLAKPIPPDRYEALARKVAEQYKWLKVIDPRSFSISQLMYWPSTSKDGEYKFNFYSDASNLDGGTFLTKQYTDWRDRHEWPAAPHEHIRRDPTSPDGRRKDPRESSGIVGLFCQEYSIQDAINEFLPDVYESTSDPDRFKLASSSSTAGLQVFGGNNNDLFCCSWHANDPINQEQAGQTVNAFDLVRIHKFGYLDDPNEDYTHKIRPSTKKMMEFAGKIPGVQNQYLNQVNQARTNRRNNLKDYSQEQMKKFVIEEFQLDHSSHTPKESPHG